MRLCTSSLQNTTKCLPFRYVVDISSQHKDTSQVTFNSIVCRFKQHQNASLSRQLGAKRSSSKNDDTRTNSPKRTTSPLNPNKALVTLSHSKHSAQSNFAEVVHTQTHVSCRSPQMARSHTASSGVQHVRGSVLVLYAKSR